MVRQRDVTAMASGIDAADFTPCLQVQGRFLSFATVRRLSGFAHAAHDIVGAPTRQRGKVCGLLPVPGGGEFAIGVGGRTGRGTGPRVAQDIASLEVLAVARLQEYQVVRE